MSYNVKSTYLVPSVTLKVMEVDGICGEYMSCMSMVKLSKFPEKLMVRVKIEDEDSK